MTVLTCPRCGNVIEVSSPACQAWHASCEKRGPRELAPEYREEKA